MGPLAVLSLSRCTRSAMRSKWQRGAESGVMLDVRPGFSAWPALPHTPLFAYSVTDFDMPHRGCIVATSQEIFSPNRRKFLCRIAGFS